MPGYGATIPLTALRQVAETCRNLPTWPVLAGEEGDRYARLSSPIILYDYPCIAPESQGHLFDSTESDHLRMLDILTLTDAEKGDMCACESSAREIRERRQALTAEAFMRQNGEPGTVHLEGGQLMKRGRKVCMAVLLGVRKRITGGANGGRYA